LKQKNNPQSHQKKSAHIHIYHSFDTFAVECLVIVVDVVVVPVCNGIQNWRETDETLVDAVSANSLN
jgi:hypothetical protein